MPLLCISLLALLLLPLSLSYDCKPSDQLRNNMDIVQIDLVHANESIETLLQNISCSAPHRRLPNCVNNNLDAVSTLHNLTCKMKNLNVPVTNQLVGSVLGSLKCLCPQKPTKEPKRRRRTVTRRKRDGQKIRREAKKLCRVKAILSAMTVCCEKLNTISAT